MNDQLNIIVGNIIGKELSECTDTQLKSELNAFIQANGGEDFLVDDDLEYLCSIAAQFTNEDVSEHLEQVSLITSKPSKLYKRVGRTLEPKNRDCSAAKRIAESITKIHLDLLAEYKEKGISFLNDVNAVFSLNSIRSVENMPYEYSCVLVLYNIKTQEQLENAIPERYLSTKKWSFVGKQNRCEGRHFTVTELIDLLYDRKIITFTPYE